MKKFVGAKSYKKVYGEILIILNEPVFCECYFDTQSIIFLVKQEDWSQVGPLFVWSQLMASQLSLRGNPHDHSNVVVHARYGTAVYIKDDR